MFNMTIIKEFPCQNRREAEAEEDSVMREFKSGLNMMRAYLSPEEKKGIHNEYNSMYNKKSLTVLVVVVILTLIKKSF